MEEVSDALARAVLEQFMGQPYVQPKHRDASLFADGTADLRLSSRSGNLNKVRGVLGVGAAITETDSDGNTPLMAAREATYTDVAHYIAWEHDELVRVLAKCLGRPPTQMEIDGVATLKRMRKFRQRIREYVAEMFQKQLEAARAGDLVSVHAMLERGDIGVNVIDRMTGETAWSAALGHGHVPLCLYLMERGARVDGACWIKGQRYDLLVAAVFTGNVDLVRRVVARGVSLVRSEDDDDDKIIRTCAMTEAVKIGSIEMIETLLELGVRFDRMKNGLQLPDFFLYLVHLMEPLVRAGATMEVEPWFLLCAACWFQNHTIFDYLITKYSVLQDLRQSPKNAARVLFLAVYRENDEMVQELLRRGAPINCSDSLNAIVAAMRADSLRMLEFLLARGANVNVSGYNAMSGSYCDSLLASAVHSGNMDCARRLLPLETRRYYREGAFVTAVTVGNLEIVSLIVDSMQDLSIHNLQMCITAAQCPLILDLVLAKCCGDRFPISFFCTEFSMACREGKSTDLLGVFVAHGIDVTRSTMNGLNSTSLLMTSVLGEWNDEVRPTTLEFVLANGMPSLTTDRYDMTPEMQLKARGSAGYAPTAAKKASFVACQEILAAYS